MPGLFIYRRIMQHSKAGRARMKDRLLIVDEELFESALSYSKSVESRSSLWPRARMMKCPAAFFGKESAKRG